MSLLEIKNLSVSIRSHPLIDNISFQINKGEIFALVGQSGSGKTLTAFSVLKLLHFLGNFDVSGEVLFDCPSKQSEESHLNKYDVSSQRNKSNKINTLSLTEREMSGIRGNRIAMIFQDPMTSLNPLHNIGKQLAEAIDLHQKLSRRQVHARIIELVEMVELHILKDRLKDYPHQLSGGQRQRVMIAMALANDPDLIIADEPTTALDVTVQKGILALLKKLQLEKNIGILLITHDLTIVQKVADRVAVMNAGKIVELKNTADIFSGPSHEYTKKLLSAEPRSDLQPTEPGARELLAINNLDVSYQIGKNFFGLEKTYFDAVKNVSLKLLQGQTIGIVGESGSGKSTLAKAILKLVSSNGQMILNGHDISEMNERQFKPYRKQVQIVFQDPYSSLNPRMTIRNIIAEGLLVHQKLSGKEIDSIIDRMLLSLGLKPSYKNRYPHELSGGEKQRIGLARSLVLNPDILVLDEPTSALDLITQSEILHILMNIQQELKLGMLFISHDLRVIRAVSHYIIVMRNGLIVNQGAKDDIFTKANEQYTKNLIESAFLQGI